MQAVAVASERSSRWGWVSSMAIVAAFSIMVTYSVVSGWVLSYLSGLVVAQFFNMDAAQPEAGKNRLLGLGRCGLDIARRCALCSSIGDAKGIERAVKILMPWLLKR